MRDAPWPWLSSPSAFLTQLPISVAALSLLLLLSLPGRYLTRERGWVFDFALGACCGIQFVAFAAYSMWVWQPGGWVDISEAWCEGRLALCYALVVPYGLLWLAYWTLLPALLAAALIRAGRALMRCLGRAGSPAAG
jgi:glucan phosphoethanolaminetransferase (alkaline phosphatase superfamily)